MLGGRPVCECVWVWPVYWCAIPVDMMVGMVCPSAEVPIEVPIDVPIDVAIVEGAGGGGLSRVSFLR